MRVCINLCVRLRVSMYYVSMMCRKIYIYISLFPARSHRSACGFLSHWVGVVVLSAILTIIFSVSGLGVDFRPIVFPSFISAASLAVPLQAYHTQSRLMKEAVVNEEQHATQRCSPDILHPGPVTVHLVFLSSFVLLSFFFFSFRLLLLFRFFFFFLILTSQLL